MTSITMAVTSLPTWIDPKGMNQWLKEHHGYINETKIVDDSIAPFGLKYGGSNASSAFINVHILNGESVLANIKNQHWVFATMYGDGFVYVNDPKYSKTTYTFAEISFYKWYTRVKLPIKIGSWITSESELFINLGKQKVKS